MKKWAGRLLKTAIFFGIFIVIMLTVLVNMGGSNETLKGALEDYFASATRMDANIKTLNKMTFFPNIGADMEGIELADPNNETRTITVESAKVALGFWDIILGNRTIRDLNIKNAVFSANTLAEQPVTIDELAINEDAEGRSFLQLNGQIGEEALSAEVDLSNEGDVKNPQFELSDESAITASLGKLKFTGTIRPRTIGGFHVRDFTLSSPQETVKGNMSFVRGKGRVDVEGDFEFPQHGSIVDADLAITRGPVLDITGTLDAKTFAIEDFTGASYVITAINEWDRIFPSPNDSTHNPFAGKTADIDFKAESFLAGGKALGSVSAPLTIKDGTLSFSPLSGTLSGGDVSGDIILKGSENAINGDINITVKNFDYGRLQERTKETADITGMADIKIKLKGQSANLDGLLKALRGNILFIGGRGHMHSGIIDLWGGGLVNAIIPDIGEASTINVNCAIADLEIQNAIATAKNLFLDTQRVTVAGEGTYNIDQNNLDVKLKPKTKSVSLGDISSAVIISGPIGKPSITPSTLDLGKKIGGLLLGTVNPAFLAFTLADLNMGDDHPCKAFIKVSDDDVIEVTNPEAENK